MDEGKVKVHVRMDYPGISQLKNLFAKGYPKQLSDEEAKKEETRSWYFPKFIVLNPNKPGKIRLVWDAVVETNVVCLNDFLLSGPDCLNSLINVLPAFRVGTVAVSGDIAEMFHRINISHEDMHSQRFLWYDVNRNKINTYVMRAMTLGISCAPFIGHYVRDKKSVRFSCRFSTPIGGAYTEPSQTYLYISSDFKLNANGQTCRQQ